MCFCDIDWYFLGWVGGGLSFSWLVYLITKTPSFCISFGNWKRSISSACSLCDGLHPYTKSFVLTHPFLYNSLNWNSECWIVHKEILYTSNFCLHKVEHASEMLFTLNVACCKEWSVNILHIYWIYLKSILQIKNHRSWKALSVIFKTGVNSVELFYYTMAMLSIEAL